jgi:MoaA/NifB/PqqE/SkfB family radical SAM enzyme
MQKNRLRELIFSVTNKCNHKCKMCYYHQTLADEMREMSIAEIESVSRSLGSIDRLWISGGEPLIRPDLVEICRIFHRNNGVRHFFLPTNGSMPDRIAETAESIADLSPQVSLQIMFSMEGKEEVHDAIHQKSGAFKKIVASVELLQRTRLRRIHQNKPIFSVLMNTVVTNQNSHEVIPLMEWVIEHLWVDLHTYSPVRGNALDPAHSQIDAEEFGLLFEQALPVFKRYLARKFGTRNPSEQGLESIEKRYGSWLNVLRGGSLGTPCVAGEGIGVLEPNGAVRVCELKPVVGNVRSLLHDFNEVWNSDAAQDMKATVAGCSCTHACFMNASEQFATDTQRLDTSLM